MKHKVPIKKSTYRYKQKRKESNYTMLFTVTLVFLIFAYLLGVINKNIRPTLTAIAESKAKYMASQTISDAVLTSISSDLKYEDLVSIQRTVPDKTTSSGQVSYGQVSSITANTMKMNEIAAQVTSSINNQIAGMQKSTQISIPIGSLLGTQFLANYGPSIKLRVLPVGSANVTFSTDFTSSGINQTRHRIYLKVKVTIRVVMPLIATAREPVETMIPIAETVIVGPIPNSYIDTNTSDSLNFIN